MLGLFHCITRHIKNRGMARYHRIEWSGHYYMTPITVPQTRLACACLLFGGLAGGARRAEHEFYSVRGILLALMCRSYSLPLILVGLSTLNVIEKF